MEQLKPKFTFFSTFFYKYSKYKLEQSFNNTFRTSALFDFLCIYS